MNTKKYLKSEKKLQRKNEMSETKKKVTFS